MPEDNITRKEHDVVHKTLKDSIHEVVELVKSNAIQLSDQINAESQARKADSLEHKAEMKEMMSSLSTAIHDINEKREQAKGIPYPLLSLIFGVILAIGGALTWNMSRIEGRVQGQSERSRELSHKSIEDTARLDERVKEIKRIQILEVDKRENN